MPNDTKTRRLYGSITKDRLVFPGWAITDRLRLIKQVFSRFHLMLQVWHLCQTWWLGRGLLSKNYTKWINKCRINLHKCRLAFPYSKNRFRTKWSGIMLMHHQTDWNKSLKNNGSLCQMSSKKTTIKLRGKRRLQSQKYKKHFTESRCLMFLK